MARDEFQPQAEGPAEVELPVRSDARGLDGRMERAEGEVERQEEPVEVAVEEMEQGGTPVERQTDADGDVERE